MQLMQCIFWLLRFDGCCSGLVCEAYSLWIPLQLLKAFIILLSCKMPSASTMGSSCCCPHMLLCYLWYYAYWNLCRTWRVPWENVCTLGSCLVGTTCALSSLNASWYWRRSPWGVLSLRSWGVSSATDGQWQCFAESSHFSMSEAVMPWRWLQQRSWSTGSGTYFSTKS